MKRLRSAARRNPARKNEDYNIFFDDDGYEVVPETFKKVYAVVVSSEYDEPVILTSEGEREFKYLSGERYTTSTPRHHPALIWLALRRRGAFLGGVTVEDVPGGKYLIERGAGGYEKVVTPQDRGWVTI